jgi:hypothetical protein
MTQGRPMGAREISGRWQERGFCFRPVAARRAVRRCILSAAPVGDHFGQTDYPLVRFGQTGWCPVAQETDQRVPDRDSGQVVCEGHVTAGTMITSQDDAHISLPSRKKAGIERTSLYRAFAGGPQYPNFKTVLSVLDAMGFQLRVTARRGEPQRQAHKANSPESKA